MRSKTYALVLTLAATFSFGTLAHASSSAAYVVAPHDVCAEAATNAIIDYLEAEEPTSEVHIVKSANEKTIVGLIDVNDVYPSFDFSAVYEQAPNTQTFEFRSDDFIVFAEVEVFAPHGLVACTVTNVDSGQDDQD